MFPRKLWFVAAAALVPAVASAQIGDPDDMYVMSDSHSELYQFDRVSPWNHVPGSYTGALASPYDQVFSNSTQLQSNAPYLGAVAGSSDNFFIGGFAGLTEINSSTGAFVQTIGSGERLGPAEGPNGNIVVGGPTGIEEYNSDTGAFVRTINSAGNGRNMFTFNGDEMFVANWSSSSTAFGIQRYSFTTGATTNPTISVPFAPQEIAIGPDGALYATALYEGAGVEGLWRYDFGAASWGQYIDVTSLTGGGPHGFAWDPNTLDIYMTFNSGQIYRFDQSGTFLNLANSVPTAKLTDILFTEVIPEPASLLLVGLGGVLLIGRRR